MAPKDPVPRLRSPIVSVLGHVDHGKSSLLDSIRGTNVTAGEAGAITQAIGASIIPLDVVKKRCGPLLASLKLDVTIPGLLFIDTPGHAAFTTLRKRGGALADLAVLVVDINEGFKPQTFEALEILRGAKTPFLIAANKLDLVHGFRLPIVDGEEGSRQSSLLLAISAQEVPLQQQIENRIYTLVGTLYEKAQMQAERFDRVADYTRQIAIVPCSATTGLGVSELLMVLAGLAQKYLEGRLALRVDGPAKGTILEVKESTGLGLTADAIIYDGTLRRGDTIVIASEGEPIITKVRALLEPLPLAEMRDKKAKFRPVEEAVAATGVKIAAPGLDAIIPGMPLIGASTPAEIESAKRQVQAQLDELAVHTDDEGVIIKADTLGSLEALSRLLRERGIAVRKATIGPVTKKDIKDAEANLERDPLTAIVLGFNVASAESSERVTVFTNPVIYRLIDDYAKWRDERLAQTRKESLGELLALCRIEVLQGCIFRQSNPAVVGVEVLAGTLLPGTQLMKLDGTRLATVKEMQQESKTLARAERGFQLAASLPGVVCGRHLNEHDILITDLDEKEFRRYKEYKDLLTEEQKTLLKEIAEIKRRANPVWGV